MVKIYEEERPVSIYFDENVGTVEEFEAKTSWKRWPLLFLMSNSILFVSAASLCFSPVSNELAKAYNVPQIEVNMCGIIFTATFVPLTFVTMWLYKHWKNQNVLKLGMLLLTAGAWFRFIAIGRGFWPVLLG
jgi:NADH:ubiquinone oxidoreductase subunit 2 (subunit N)